MSLKTYKQKRTFKGKNKTTEPIGKRKKQGKKQIFVIHKHHASHLHWDLRLEINGVLASWAVPKEPPTKTEVKRLAVHVEDHPLEYAKFHGTIPEGNYGAGTVEIWDKGTYELFEKTPKKILFALHGKKLNGRYVLVKTGYGGKKSGWLWFRV